MERYDKYDKTIAKWYEAVVGQGYHKQQVYIDELLGLIMKGSSVLELGCGTGEITIPLANSGINVEGLDKSKPMTKKLLSKRPIQVHNQDVMDFTPSKRYDWVISSSGVFSVKGGQIESYLLEREDVANCITKYTQSSQNGILINRGYDKDNLRLNLESGELFVHRELREGDFMIAVHMMLKNGALLGQRTHVKRRYNLKDVLKESRFTQASHNFFLIY